MKQDQYHAKLAQLVKAQTLQEMLVNLARQATLHLLQDQYAKNVQSSLIHRLMEIFACLIYIFLI